MAGNYFPDQDPRPFYHVTADQKYAFLDDCFTPTLKKDPKIIESELKLDKGKGGGKDGNKERMGKVEMVREEEVAGAEAGAGAEVGGGKKGKGGGGGGDAEKVETKSKIQVVELNVNVCCDNCVRKVKDALDNVEGVERVDCDQIDRKVYVKSSLKPEDVLKKVKNVKDDATLVVKKK